MVSAPLPLIFPFQVRVAPSAGAIVPPLPDRVVTRELVKVPVTARVPPENVTVPFVAPRPLLAAIWTVPDAMVVPPL